MAGDHAGSIGNLLSVNAGDVHIRQTWDLLMFLCAV